MDLAVAKDLGFYYLVCYQKLVHLVSLLPDILVQIIQCQPSAIFSRTAGASFGSRQLVNLRIMPDIADNGKIVILSGMLNQIFLAYQLSNSRMTWRSLSIGITSSRRFAASCSLLAVLSHMA